MSTQFTTPLVITPTASGRWVLVEPFEFWSKGGELVVVPAGFVTDFASIPKVLWSIYSPWHPTYGKAAVIHDYLYATQDLYLRETFNADGTLLEDELCPMTRKRADQMFLEGMQVLGCNWFRRTLMYQSVRWFARGAWEMHRVKLSTAKTVADVLAAKRAKEG